MEDAVNYIPPELTAFAILLSLFASLNPSFPCAGGFSSDGVFPWRSLIPLVFLKRHPGCHNTQLASPRTVLGDWICPVPGGGAGPQPDGTALGCAPCRHLAIPALRAYPGHPPACRGCSARPGTPSPALDPEVWPRESDIPDVSQRGVSRGQRWLLCPAQIKSGLAPWRLPGDWLATCSLSSLGRWRRR